MKATRKTRSAKTRSTAKPRSTPKPRSTKPKTRSTKSETRSTKSASAATSDVREIKTFRAQLQKLVPAAFAASQELRRWMAEENGEKVRRSDSIESALGRPCSESKIQSVAEFHGRPLPASYVAYLSLYGDGKKQFGAPIGPDDHGMASGALESLSDLFDEFGDDNPITEDVIAFYIHMDSRDSVLFIPRKRGGTDIVTYDRITKLQRYPDLVSYYRDTIAVTRRCIADYVKRKKKRGKGAIQTVRQAFDAVLAGTPLNKKAFNDIVERLQGHIPDGHLPSGAALRDLANGAESKRFVAALLALDMPEVVLMSIAYDAVDLLNPQHWAPSNQREQNVEKALPVVEILFEIARRNPKRPAGKKYELFLRTLNSAIHETFARENFALAGRLAELAIPYARDDLYIPHNSACAFAANKRYDEALEMCRIAVASEYSSIDNLRTDKDLGLLLRRPDFKALFA